MESFFEKVPYVRYEGPKSRNPFAFRFYNPDEVLAGKPMREHLRFAMSYWHTLGQEGRDPFGDGTTDKTFGGVEPMEISRRRAFAAFELMDKLSLDYFCFHDRDLAPEGKTLAETNARLDEIADLLERLMKEHGKRLLWGTANLFTNPRYLHGAATSCNADVFVFAAAQVKKALDLTCRLHGDGFVFWGGREGYETLLNTDMGLELDNYACFLRMAADYAQSIGFTGGLYLEPKPKEPCKHQYDFDASTVLAFLRRYGLADRFRLNIEANHATLAGHTFQHELRVARLNGALGSLDINEGDPNLGWDTDKFPSNVYDATFCLYEILEMGGLKKGGLNFDAKTRRPSFTREDIALSYIAGMDTFALGLRAALRLREDGRLQEFIRTRYRSYESGVGLEIRSGRATLESLAQYALVKGKVEQMQSGRQEYLEGIVNQILFGSALC